MVVGADRYLPGIAGCVNCLYARFCASPICLCIVLNKKTLMVVLGT